MPDLAKTLAQFRQVLEAELGACLLSPLNALWAMELRFREEFIEIYNVGDRKSATPHLENITDVRGLKIGKNTSVAGEIFLRFVTNGGNFDVVGYPAAGGSGAIAKATNVAAGATATMVEQNSSGLEIDIDLGATVVADASDLHKLVFAPSLPLLLDMQIDDAQDDDDDAKASKAALLTTYREIADGIAGLRATLKAKGFQAWAISGDGNPRARLITFLQGGDREKVPFAESLQTDGNDGNVTVQRSGILEWLRLCMEANTGGGEIDVVKRTVACTAATVPGGKIAILGHDPGQACPEMRVDGVCVEGADRGFLGREKYRLTGTVLEDGVEREIALGDLIVGQTFYGPEGFGGADGITATRVLSKTGDGGDTQLAAASFFSTTGERETPPNTSSGSITWKVTGAGPFTFWFYRDPAMQDDDLVAKATGVAANTVFTARAQKSSGLTIVGKSGSAPVAASTGTLELNPSLETNASTKTADRFSMVVSVSGTVGRYQETTKREFPGAALNEDTSGSETIRDGSCVAGLVEPTFRIG